MESEFTVIHRKNSNHDIKHYQKINIFGDAGVGKTSLISHMVNYNNEEFKIENIIIGSDLSIKSYDNSSSLVEQIKRIKITINKDDDIELLLNVYETNLDRYDSIKMNLDTLLLQTECIIIMWDINKIDSFDNIPNLISTINTGIKDYKFRDVPIFLIKNKIDLEIRESEKNELENDINASIEKIKSENKNVIFKEISLLEKDDFLELILDINRKINTSNKIIESRNNYDNPCLVKFKKYKKMSLDFEILDNNMITINCVLLGHSSVGKTTFFNYFYGKNNENNLSTISKESLLLLAEFNNEKFYVKISDTAGQERFLSIAKSYIRDADGILLFFDVTKKESFENIEKWISIIKDTIGDDSKIILIANKIDTTDDRVIYKKDAKEKANKYNFKYFECCCLNGLNLYEILNEIIVAAYSKYYEKNPNGIKRANTLKLNENKSYWKGWKNYCWENMPSMPSMPHISLNRFRKSSKTQITLKQQ